MPLNFEATSDRASSVEAAKVIPQEAAPVPEQPSDMPVQRMEGPLARTLRRELACVRAEEALKYELARARGQCVPSSQQLHNEPGGN